MIEQMQKQMDAAALDDEAQLRNRILVTQELLRAYQNEYQERYGAPPTPIRLDVPEPQGAQFVSDEDDALDRLLDRCDAEVAAEAAGLSAQSYDQRDPNADLHEEAQQSNLYGDGDLVSVESREKQIDEYEAGGGFADTDPDGMS